MEAKQATDTLLMIRPVAFSFNEQTGASNAFQSSDEGEDKSKINEAAQAEFDAMVQTLGDHGVNVIVIDDTPSPHTPDAVFPNNWVSFHSDGTIITYPMMATNRRLEIREDVLDKVCEQTAFKKRKRLHMEQLTEHGLILEGTGSMIIDRVNNIIYACLSPRTNAGALEKLAEHLNYDLVSFRSVDAAGQEIYHTNVMMCLGDKFAVLGAESIKDEVELGQIRTSLRTTGHEVVELSTAQLEQFAGNMLQVCNSDGENILVMSQAAYDSLEQTQIDTLSGYNKLLAIPIPTIEKYGGGSTRCMLAEVFY